MRGAKQAFNNGCQIGRNPKTTAHLETIVWKMKIPREIKGSFAIETLVRHEVGHVPKDVPAHLALVDDVALSLQDSTHLKGGNF